MSKIFGGSKSKSKSRSQQQSTSYNKAYEGISRDYGQPGAQAYQTGLNALNSELSGGFDAYKANNNMDFAKLLGLERTFGDFSGRSVANSGAARKALVRYESDYNDRFYQSYLDQLFRQAQLGMGGGQLTAGTGGYSSSSGSSYGESSGKSSPGLGGFIGGSLGRIVGG